MESVVLRKAPTTVAAVIPIHEPDAILFLDQLLAEMDRLGWSVAWHMDSVSDETRQRIHDWHRTIGYTSYKGLPGSFWENHRQGALQIAQASGIEWFVNHDADETWEPDAPQKLAELMRERVLWKVRWLNVWKTDEQGNPLVRVDTPFVRPRYRLHPVGPWKWEYRDPAIASPWTENNRPCEERQSQVAIIHWGFATQELRERHFRFWHGRVPSGMWLETMNAAKSPVLNSLERAVAEDLL